MFKTILLAICIALCAAALWAQPTSESRKRPFRVEDSIAITRVLDPDDFHAGVGLPYVRDKAGTFSPDGLSVAVLLTSGDVSNNVNVYKLVIYETASLFAKPRSREVIQMLTTSSRPGITKIKWLADSRRIAFLGERPHEQPQLWIVDTQTSQLMQLTHYSSGITNYDITPSGTAWIYAASPERTKESLDAVERGFVFDWPNQILGNVLAKQYGQSPPSYYSDVYLGKEGRTSDLRVKQQTQFTPHLAIAPDGRHAVEFRQMTEPPPEEWTRYQDADLKRIVAAARANVDEETHLFEYFVIDCETASIRLLVPLPGFGIEPPLMTQDGSEVILFQTYLPFSVPNAAKTGYNNVLAVSLDGSKTTVVRTEPDHQWFNAEGWDPKIGRLILQRGQTEDFSIHTRGDEWRAEEDFKPFLRITMKEGLNEPPELEAQERGRDGILKRSIISHLNAHLDGLSLTHVKTLEWRGKDDLAWRALVYMPPDYRPGQRYPLVVQTHGYSERTFQPDGKSTTVMAAQALANSNMIVVQLGNATGGAPRSLAMCIQWMKGVEGLIDELDEKGLIEKDRVGLVGWSSSGWLVEYFLSHSAYTIGAAIVADNIDYGYLQYLTGGNSPASVASFEKQIYGGSPWEKPDIWIKESPGFNLQRIHTPLRMEAETDSALAQWEIYAGLKILHKPVELVIFPDATHDLVRPWHRLTSQGGAVDWFRFWLKGEEDSTGAKAAQMARWRKMRDDMRLGSTAVLDK